MKNWITKTYAYLDKSLGLFDLKREANYKLLKNKSFLFNLN